MNLITRKKAKETAEVAAPGTLLTTERAHRSGWSRGWTRFKRYKPALVGLVFLGILAVLSIIPGPFAPYDPTFAQPDLLGAPPSWSHPLGFDEIGRDVLSRIVYGTRIALIVALLATAMAVTIGVLVGAAAGYFGGWVDSVLSRLVDTIMAFPTIALLIALVAVVGPSLKTTIVVIGATVWASYARVARADVLSLRERDYIVAARAVGANHLRIIVRHIVPNIAGPIIVLSTLAVGSIIILEAALSFLGLGVQPPTPDWGTMLASSRAYIQTYPHIAIAPGVMISLTVLAFNLIGDGLRDALDPRGRD
ncbi:MAG TPA: ABC transporter permease [Nitrolancea sp.]|jgi:peptide/nickel transport system permease protein|nr:ABC transporter permease [Nitrolancea sp.]